MPAITSRPHTLKPLERIPNERQRHISRMLIPKRIHSSPLLRARIILWDLVDGEVADVSSGLQRRFKGSVDAAELVPVDAAEEGVGFDLLGAVLAVVAAEAVVDVAEHAVRGVVSIETRCHALLVGV